MKLFGKSLANRNIFSIFAPNFIRGIDLCHFFSYH